MEACRHRVPAFFLGRETNEFENVSGNRNRLNQYTGSRIPDYGIYGYRSSIHDRTVCSDEYIQVSPDESEGYGPGSEMDDGDGSNIRDPIFRRTRYHPDLVKKSGEVLSPNLKQRHPVKG